jgi:ABC-type branched-subunit amino acid transport system substrate-binding protein
MVFTSNCVLNPRFKSVLSTFAQYVMNALPWTEVDTLQDDIVGWSPADFAAKYQKQFGGIMPTYHAAQAFAGGLLLVRAIEECQCSDPSLVAQQLVKTKVRTVDGN